MDIQFKLNNPQLSSLLLNAKHETQVWGRGTGKSSVFATKIHRNVKSLPRSSSVITGKTFTQILGTTLPSTVSFLERIGYVRDKDYFIGRKPPKSYGWTLPYEAPLDFSHYMVFGSKKGAVGFHLSSQDRNGLSRGLNTDFEFTDETLLLDKERYDKEIAATNRGNLDRYSLTFHHGTHHCTSMPFTQDSKWILNPAEYYYTERGIRLFDAWNKICRLQLDLLTIDDPVAFAAHWNEIARLRQAIQPFVATGINSDGTKNQWGGTLFSLANCFDNIQNLGMSYIKDQFKKSSPLTFYIEMMNMVLDKVEDAYYQLDNDMHIYYDSYDYNYIDSLDYNFSKLSSRDSRFDSDVDKTQPLYIDFDFNSRITVMLVNQINGLVDADGIDTFNIVKEFYTKPESGRIPIDDIVDEFCTYYNYHQDKIVMFIRDKYGDEGRANSSETYNEQVISRFLRRGWNIVEINYPGKEPPHHDKYLLLANLFNCNIDYFPIRINGNNCKNTIISLNNTRVIEKDNRFSKDKGSERLNSGVLPEHATHFSDTFDKIVWVRYHAYAKGTQTSIPIRIKSR